MRRVIVCLLLCLLSASGAAAAQDGRAVWLLNQAFTVSDLQFQFLYPENWLTDTSSGIQLAETQADLDALLDADPATQPAGPTIALAAAPLATFNLGDAPTLEQIADFIVQSGGITVIDTVEVPVMTRRSLSVIGSSSDGRSGIATVWLQNDFVVIFTLGTPNNETTQRLAFSWGQLLGTAIPLNTLPLGEARLTLPNAGFSLRYPLDWVTNSNWPNIVAERGEDLSLPLPAQPGGFMILAVENTRADLNLPPETTVIDLAVVNRARLTYADTATTSQHIILDQPAITLLGDSPTRNSWFITTQLFVNDIAVTLVLIAPDEEALRVFEPTWLAMLQTILPLET